MSGAIILGDAPAEKRHKVMVSSARNGRAGSKLVCEVRSKVIRSGSQATASTHGKIRYGRIRAKVTLLKYRISHTPSFQLTMLTQIPNSICKETFIHLMIHRVAHTARSKSETSSAGGHGPAPIFEM